MRLRFVEAQTVPPPPAVRPSCPKRPKLSKGQKRKRKAKRLRLKRLGLPPTTIVTRLKAAHKPFNAFQRLNPVLDARPLLSLGVSREKRRRVSFIRTAAFPPEQRQQARLMVKEALRGRLLVRQPCVIPTCQKRAEAHHPDYSRPLLVIWLCESHHWEEHGYTNEEVAAWGWTKGMLHRQL
jgi:hypothetical protein